MLGFRHIVGLMAAGALAGAGSSALAAGSVVQTATASVGVNTFVSMTATQNLVFGAIVRPGNGNTNTVTVSNAGVRSISGTGDGALGAGAPAAAAFNLTAPGGTTYATVQSLVMTPAGLTNTVANTPTVTAGTLGTVPGGGTQIFNIGGAFDLTAATPAQAYSGTLSLTINYN